MKRHITDRVKIHPTGKFEPKMSRKPVDFPKNNRKLAPGLDLIPFEANSSQNITAVSIIILFMVKYGSKWLKILPGVIHCDELASNGF